MRVDFLLALGLVFAMAPKAACPQGTISSLDPVIVKVFVQEDTSRLPDFVVSLRREFAERGMNIQLVEHGQEFEYNIAVVQETSVGGAAAAVIVLDKSCMFVASVVRSGRVSGKGAFNASAKELAKKIAALRGLR